MSYCFTALCARVPISGMKPCAIYGRARPSRKLTALAKRIRRKNMMVVGWRGNGKLYRKKTFR